MNIDTWTQSFINAVSDFWVKIVEFTPNFVAALLIFIVGIIVSKLIARWVSNIFKKLGIDGLCKRVGLVDLLKKVGLNNKPHELLRKLLYFFLALFVVLSFTEILGLDRVTSILDDFVLYLPKLFGALIVILIGAFIGHQARLRITSVLENMQMEHASAMGRIIQMVVFITTFSLALGQLQIETQMLNILFGIILTTLGVSAAIAMGLGTRDVASNIVSGIYAREQIQSGDMLIIDKFKGQVVQVGTVSTVLENKSGERLSVPNHYLLSNRFQFKISNQENSETG